MTPNADKDELRSLRQRWDDNRRSQFGLTQATLVTLAGGGLGFCGNLLTKGTPRFGDFATTLFIWTSSAFAIALVLGIFSTCTRLIDFRLTAMIPKKRLQLIQKKAVDGISISTLKCITSILGECTWSLLWMQLTALLAGVCLLPITLFHLFFHLIYPRN